jgi:hypothetical protein
VAIDQTLGRHAFAGVEYSGRDLTIPHVLLPEGTLTEQSGDERLARAYLFGAPHPWFTLGAEYQYEKLDRDPELLLSYSRVKTHRVPLSARFFHPSGIGALVGVTYLKQDGDFRPSGGSDFVPGNRSFWVVDAAVRYRLPQRYGFVVVGVNNLTDERSTYEATDSQNVGIRPGRVVFARVIVAFP